MKERQCMLITGVVTCHIHNHTETAIRRARRFEHVMREERRYWIEEKDTIDKNIRCKSLLHRKEEQNNITATTSIP